MGRSDALDHRNGGGAGGFQPAARSAEPVMKAKEARIEIKDKPTTVKTIRKCLKCGVDFESWGPGNRMCYECRRRPDKEQDW